MEYLINKILEKYPTLSRSNAKRIAAAWDHYDSWSDKFNFDKFVRDYVRKYEAFARHYGDYD